MAKTGTGEQLGTAEGAVLSRALHARFAEDPILDDHWAIELLPAEVRDRVEAADGPEGLEPTPGFDASPVFALGVACLRYAEDAVEQGVEEGIEQYAILGAGFDTFALRRGDLCPPLAVYEIDHPDVQKLKRERVAAARREPAATARFVPVDFETTALAEALAGSDFEPARPAVVSWLNTLPYLTREATVATLAELRSLLAPGSRLVVNYGADVPMTPEQIAFLTRLAEVVASSGEPTRSRWTPDEFEAVLEREGFAVREHWSESDLTKRYFEGRRDGLRPGVPGRIVTAEPVG
jgi:methyltransferase (TIGR00027 family)